MTIPTITINLGKKCAECGQAGAYGNGLCGSCTTKAIRDKPMKSPEGRAVQQHWRNRAAALAKAGAAP